MPHCRHFSRSLVSAAALATRKSERGWLSLDSEAFLTVNNIFNARAPLSPSNSGLPGLFYPTAGFHDDMGRFYTLGVRAKF